MPTLSSLVAMEVIVITTYGATGAEKGGIITILFEVFTGNGAILKSRTIVTGQWSNPEFYW